MPIVTGLFTDLDLSTGEQLKVVVETRQYETSWTTKQAIAGSLAFFLALVALIVLSGPFRPLVPLSVRRVFRSLDRTDLVVATALVVWWIVAPAYPDDGWFWAEHRTFSSLGEMSFLVDYWGLTYPQGHWLVWLAHSALGSTSDLVLMRLPILACVVATWLVCRVCMSTALDEKPTRSARWLLAGAFIVGATAWSMTLRPEPIVALLAIVTLAATVAFQRTPRVSSVAVAVVSVTLAVTVHPSGIVALAPVIAAGPMMLDVLRDTGRRFAGVLVVLLLAGLALCLVLLALDADLAHRLTDARLAREGDRHNLSFWDEGRRYTGFDEAGGGLPVRRLSVALMLLPVVLAISRVRAAQTSVALLPAWSVGLGVGLLAFIPSKWPWHFGALVGVGAVAVTAEAERLARERKLARRRLRLVLALMLLVVVVLVTWSAPGTSGAAVYLQRLQWRDGFDPLTLVVACLGLLCGLAVGQRIVRSRGGAPSVRLLPTTTWALVALSFVVAGITMALLIVDAAKTPWSPARQNLEALMDRESCGLADELSRNGSLAARLTRPNTATLIHPAVGVYFPCASIPRIGDGIAEIPEVVVLQGNWPLLARENPFTAVVDLYGLQRAAQAREPAAAREVRQIIPGRMRLDAIRDLDPERQ